MYPRKNARKRTKGTVLFCIVLAAVVGAAAYGLFELNNRPTDTSMDNVSASSVIVGEWGVKLQFADASSVTYQASTTDSGQQILNLMLKENVSPIASCRPLGTVITRDTTSGGDNTTKIGDFYYHLTSNSSICATDPAGPNSNVNKLRIKIDSQELGSNKYILTSR